MKCRDIRRHIKTLNAKHILPRSSLVVSLPAKSLAFSDRGWESIPENFSWRLDIIFARVFDKMNLKESWCLEFCHQFFQASPEDVSQGEAEAGVVHPIWKKSSCPWFISFSFQKAIDPNLKDSEMLEIPCFEAWLGRSGYFLLIQKDFLKYWIGEVC